MREIGIGLIVSVICLLAVSFGLNYFGYITTSFFAPRYTAIDNKVFHESAQYNDGMIRDLENLKREYNKSNETERAALKETIIHRFSIYPLDKMPPDLQSFYEGLNR